MNFNISMRMFFLCLFLFILHCVFAEIALIYYISETSISTLYLDQSFSIIYCAYMILSKNKFVLKKNI